MFGLWKKRKPQELRPPTYALVDGLQISSDEFYRSIEEELSAREVPGLDVTRIDFREGGALSARRDYLRLRRERFTFDVCSAPFGTSWFFSYRFSEIPAPLPYPELVVTLAVLAGLVFGYVNLFGLLWGGIIIGMTVIGLMLIMRNVLTLGLQDFDLWLLTVPVIGRVYELLLRKDSMFRQDTRTMYAEMMDRVLQSKIRECAAEKGVEQVHFIEARADVNPSLMRMMRLPPPETPHA